MMGGFRSIAYPLAGLLIMAVPVLLAQASVLLTLAFLRGGAQQRRTGILNIFAAGGFVLLDALLLKALPWVGLSFGPVLVSLFFLFICRMIVYVLWAGFQIRHGIASGRDNPNGRDNPSGRWASSLPFLIANICLTLLVLYGFYFEPFHLQTTQLTLRVPTNKLSSPVRIVQISDLHMERSTIREKSLAPLVNSLHPDLIVLTGDYLNLSYIHDPIAMEDARDLLAQLSAPYGVFAVNGTVDNAERMKKLFSGSGVVVLDDQVAQVNLPGGKLSIIGVSNWGGAHDAEMVRRLAARAPKDQYRLLLFHTPDRIQEAVQGEIDLYLAGHTHGGQVRLPFYGALVTFSEYGKKYEAGMYQVGGTTLYVSRGIGMEGAGAPRVRFLAPPEVVVIDLSPDT
jgi:predicted MPP superfamily phosphohydrolase